MSLGDGLTSTTFPISFPQGEGARTGGLIVVEPDEAAPEPGMDQVLSSLASQAVLVYELASVRSQRDRLLISADRERIARDLHDLVIQRLFGAGLRLQGALALIDNETVSTRISSTVDDLDTTIKEIREAIFALESAPGAGLRAACSKRWRTPPKGSASSRSFHSTVRSTARLPYRCSSKPKPSSKRPCPTLLVTLVPAESRCTSP